MLACGLSGSPLQDHRSVSAASRHSAAGLWSPPRICASCGSSPAGSLKSPAAPAGADAYLLQSVPHDWEDADAVRNLHACRAATATSGKLLVVERVIRPGNEPDLAKFMDLLILVTHGAGQRTLEESRALYAAAGSRLTTAIRTESPFWVIEGTPV